MGKVETVQYVFLRCIFLPIQHTYIIATTSIKYFVRLWNHSIQHTQHRRNYGFTGRINSLTRFSLTLCIAQRMVVIGAFAATISTTVATKKCIVNAYHEHTTIELVCSHAISAPKVHTNAIFFAHSNWYWSGVESRENCHSKNWSTCGLIPSYTILCMRLFPLSTCDFFMLA